MHACRLVAIAFALLAVPLFGQPVCGTSTDLPSCVSALYTQVVCADPAGTPPAQARCSSDWRAQWVALQSYCALPGNAATGPCKEWSTRAVARLSFEHGARKPQWQANGSIAKRTKFDLNGIPTASVARKDHLIVLVDDTNPLLYGVTAGEATAAKIDQIESLKKLVGLFGGNLQQLVQGGVAVALGGTGVEGSLKPLVDPLLRIECLAATAEVEARNNGLFIQAVESGNPRVEHRLSTPQCGPNPPSALTTVDVTSAVFAFDTANSAASVLTCSALDDLDSALSLDPAKVADMQKAIREFHTDATNCPFWRATVAGGGVGAATNLQSLQQLLTNRILNATTKADIVAVLTQQKTLVAAIAAGARLMKQSDELSSALAELPKHAAALEDFRLAVLRNAIGAPVPCTALPAAQCILSGQIVHFIVVDGVNGDEVGWDERQTQPIEIAKSGLFTENVHPVRPVKVATKYTIERASARSWDVGVSLVRTRVFDPTFTAVDAPATSAAAEPDEPTPAKKVIARTGEATRSGQLALFANIRPVGFFFPDAPAWTRALGLEIGSAVSADHPAVFGGVSLQLGRFVRIGWGHTAQRVTQLDGTAIGNEIESTEAIPTRKGFENGHYASISISLGSLPFFSTK